MPKIRILEVPATLESAVLECKKRNVNTPEVKAALDLLEPHVWPKWVVPQFHHHVENEREPFTRILLRARRTRRVVKNRNPQGIEVVAKSRSLFRFFWPYHEPTAPAP